MSPEEFERIKAEEKAHLRKLRALKQQHRDVQRKASTVKALGAMRDPNLEAQTDAMTEKLMRGAATQEARLDLAMEDEAARAKTEADAETLRQAQAADLVASLKAQAQSGDAGDAPETRAEQNVPKTIGRAAPEPEPPAAPSRDAKTIGRK